MDETRLREQLSLALKHFQTSPPTPSPRLGEGNERGEVYPRWIALLVMSAVVVFGSVYVFWGLPNPTRLSTHPAAASTKILDRHGQLLYEVFVDARRTPISLDSLPKYVWQAAIAAEDKDFFQHSGLSPRGVTRAIRNTLFRQNLQGGSTITQQLVKKALLNDDRTLRRKAREIILSLAVEALYTKNQILEFYLNQIPYGGTAYGLESAAQTYFGKPAKDLSLPEAALLAGLPQAPSRYSPFGSQPQLARERQQYVLEQMLENKYISQAEYDQALAQPLIYSSKQTLQAPHFSLWVKDLLIDKYGLEKVEQDGLVVTTSLDLDLQEFAQGTVASEVAKLKSAKVGNGAALVVQPKTGEILAMVGSKDYFDIADDGNVNVTLRSRQPGSAIKPINYALAIERKLITAATVLADKPTCFKQYLQEDYCPVNYDGQFHGPTQVRFALANSFNIPAVKTLVLNGLTDFVASASAFGITTFTDPAKYGPSLTLGGGEVTMLDLTTAYAVLANAGQRVTLNPILQVTDRDGKVLEKARLREVDTPDDYLPHQQVTIADKHYVTLPPPNTRVISPGSAYIISHILYDNGARSAVFGERSYLVVNKHPEVSVKTGTTNDRRDNWTVGYNPDILTAVWVGNNDNSPMGNVASGVTGASPIWNKIMTYALKDAPQHWPTQPPEVVGALVCSLSGLKAPESPPAECAPRYEYFLKGTVPPVGTLERRDIPMPPDNHTENHGVIFDPLGTILCTDCANFGDTDVIYLDRRGRAVSK